MTESVWHYPRPPRIDRETRALRVLHSGIVIAETTCALAVKETSGAPVYYVPPANVAEDRLTPSATRTFCEWKGEAHYFDVAGSKDAAWCYPVPVTDFAAIAGWYAFFAGRLDECWLGTERVKPQPGDFYGGWITSDVTGPFKGDPSLSIKP